MNSLRLSVQRLMTTSIAIYIMTSVLLLFTILPLMESIVLNRESNTVWIMDPRFVVAVQTVQFPQSEIEDKIETQEPKSIIIEPIEVAEVQGETESNRRITAKCGVYEGPSGRETWYNLEMDYVVELMRDLGYPEEEYPYHVTEDGIKMFGDYIMVSANLEIRPKGTILETSLGTAMVCDTGTFVEEYPEGIDIATDW